ncbi:MAG: bifunctional adenosylcobinamide kinase/adenosylcobinamide-phosphate guanylyltransferase [Oscillatoriales cyanobacterium]|nr:MAG: bifunctional adenosylcobinamide kinase/adenosylcobinamide-phosphate guanylyltransferase [Oscillatoriales cyanobacterium]
MSCGEAHEPAIAAIEQPIWSGVTVVTGPARSGKSEWAERLAARSQQPVIYIATSQLDPSDREWADRVAQHRQRRPPHWQSWDVPIDLPTALLAAPADACLLVDSLGTWVANWLDRPAEDWQAISQALVKAIAHSCSRQITLILVAEETGWGVVPAYPSGRLFRDRLGRLVRELGSRSGACYLVTGGYAVNLRAIGQSLRELSPMGEGLGRSGPA